MNESVLYYMTISNYINPAYDGVDRVLKEIKWERSYREEEVEGFFDDISTYYMAKGLMERYGLVEFTFVPFEDVRVAITKEGVKAIEAGGIREYIIDFDDSFSTFDGYPSVVTVDGKEAKFLVRCEDEFESVRIRYPDDQYKLRHRYSKRSPIEKAPDPWSWIIGIAAVIILIVALVIDHY